MSFMIDVSGDLAARSVGQQTGLLFAGVGAVLVLATLVSETLRWRQRGQPSAVIANLVSRIRAWWVMAIVVGLALFFGRAGVIVLFAIISLFALREFITLAPTRSGDYYALLAAFYIVLPWQYYLVWIDWYGMYTLLIPVYAFLFLPILATIGGDTTHYLERTSKVQWGLMICVFCISHVPLLLNLRVPGYDPARNVLLFAFLVIVVQSSDVLQYIWGKLLGKHLIAPKLSPSKTV
ncbi:MAG: phosphatidate cytidylyltransferase, partial [Stenotrophomonas sp.]